MLSVDEDSREAPVQVQSTEEVVDLPVLVGTPACVKLLDKSKLNDETRQLLYTMLGMKNAAFKRLEKEFKVKPSPLNDTQKEIMRLVKKEGDSSSLRRVVRVFCQKNEVTWWPQNAKALESLQAAWDRYGYQVRVRILVMMAIPYEEYYTEGPTQDLIIQVIYKGFLGCKGLGRDQLKTVCMFFGVPTSKKSIADLIGELILQRNYFSTVQAKGFGMNLSVRCYMLTVQYASELGLFERGARSVQDVATNASLAAKVEHNPWCRLVDKYIFNDEVNPVDNIVQTKLGEDWYKSGAAAVAARSTTENSNTTDVEKLKKQTMEDQTWVRKRVVEATDYSYNGMPLQLRKALSEMSSTEARNTEARNQAVLKFTKALKDLMAITKSKGGKILQNYTSSGGGDGRAYVQFCDKL